METLLRNLFLFLSKNRTLNKAAKRWGLRFGARRFVAGETIAEAIEAVRSLNRDGLVATLDHLGEFVHDAEEAKEAARVCVETLEAIHRSGVDSNLSVKLTQLGLDIDRALCLENMRRILDTAKRYGNFVRIDMEDFSHCQPAIDIYKELRQTYDNVGIVIQAYLYRSEQDVRELGERYDANLRLVKGAYKEPPEVAYPDKKDVDENFKKLIKLHLLGGHYTAVATHDEAIIQYTKQLEREHNIPRTRFEFQLLYGIRTNLQRQLAAEGYKVRIYVPFGKDWYGYFMRRLAERPANVAFVLKGMFR